MALIAEIGQEGAAQWVKEGTVMGHFVLHEIRDGVVICLAGERRCELAVGQHLPTFAAVEESSFASAGTPQGTTDSTPAKTPTPGPLKRPGAATGLRVGGTRSAAINRSD
jgi:hypothetical protein